MEVSNNQIKIKLIKFFNLILGRFNLVNLKDNTVLSIEPKKKRTILFSSGLENQNFIEKVISGKRYSLTFHLTKNPKNESS